MAQVLSAGLHVCLAMADHCCAFAGLADLAWRIPALAMIPLWALSVA